MGKLDAKLIEASKVLDKFNLLVAEFRVQNGMSNDLHHLYRDMGKYGNNLDLLIDEANKIEKDFEAIVKRLVS